MFQNICFTVMALGFGFFLISAMFVGSDKYNLYWPLSRSGSILMIGGFIPLMLNVVWS